MDCPVCSHTASRHFDHQKVYWFCNHCWQEVPKYDQALLPQTISSLLRQDHLIRQIKSRTRLNRPVSIIANP